MNTERLNIEYKAFETWFRNKFKHEYEERQIDILLSHWPDNFKDGSFACDSTRKHFQSWLEAAEQFDVAPGGMVKRYDQEERIWGEWFYADRYDYQIYCRRAADMPHFYKTQPIYVRKGNNHDA